MITKRYKDQHVLNKIEEGIKTDEFMINELINRIRKILNLSSFEFKLKFLTSSFLHYCFDIYGENFLMMMEITLSFQLKTI